MKYIASIVLSVVASQVCLSADLSSFMEKKREEMIKNKAKKEYIANVLETKQLSNQLEELNYREKITSINREKELILNTSIKVNIKGFVGNYVISDFVYKDKEETPLGKINIEKRRIGRFAMNTGGLFAIESIQPNQQPLPSMFTPPTSSSFDMTPQVSLPPPPPLPNR